jgi:ribosomal subunit interface protein
VTTSVGRNAVSESSSNNPSRVDPDTARSPESAGSTDPFDPGIYVRTDSSDEPSRPEAEVQVSGRNVEIPEHFRIHVMDKLSRVERFDPTIFRFDVELHHERNRRQSKVCQRLEITARGKGPVVRGEACADNFYAALDAALTKLQSRLRRTKDRRKVHHGLRTPISVAEATAAADPIVGGDSSASSTGADDRWADHNPETAGPGQIVRIKEHDAIPMTVDDALYEMELVGHDFFLFHDKETDKASVVYRRHAFDYGLLRLT